MFVDVNEFCNREVRDVDWLVDGLIERGSNGFIAADPKGSKSLTTAALCVSLALGEPWLEFRIPKRVKVALVSREDNPEMTQRRIKQIIKGKRFDVQELRGFLYINSKRETPRFSLDNPGEFKALIADLKRVGAEFVALDVFNKMHTQDENDNSKMRTVLDKIDRIYEETGAQVCILHHLNKGDTGVSITKRIRGAGAIAGAAEWIVGIEMAEESTETRIIQFEIKGGGRIAPIYFKIEDNIDKSEIRLEVVDKPVREVKQKPKAASAGLFGGVQ
jgi:RecA-family ATPase